MLLLALASVVALQAWAWRSLSSRVARGALTRVRALLQYALWALAPTLLLIGAFLAAVGLEEWLRVALIPEPVARSVLPVGLIFLGVAGLGSICFGIRSVWLRGAGAGRG